MAVVIGYDVYFGSVFSTVRSIKMKFDGGCGCCGVCVAVADGAFVDSGGRMIAVDFLALSSNGRIVVPDGQKSAAINWFCRLSTEDTLN